MVDFNCKNVRARSYTRNQWQSWLQLKKRNIATINFRWTICFPYFIRHGLRNYFMSADGDCQSQSGWGGTNLLFGQFSPKAVCKWRKTGPKRRVCPPVSLIQTPNGLIAEHQLTVFILTVDVWKACLVMFSVACVNLARGRGLSHDARNNSRKFFSDWWNIFKLSFCWSCRKAALGFPGWKVSDI